MKISANQLSTYLGKSLSPCYLVAGDELLLVQEALDAIREHARAAGFTSRDLYVATQGFDWRDITAAGGNLSLFAEKRIVELRLPTGKPGREGSAVIVDMLEQLDDDLLFIVTTPKLDRSSAASKWAKALEAAGMLVQIWPVRPNELAGWVNARMRAADLQPDRDAAQLIADRIEGNLLAAQQEIEKLRLLHGPGPISASQVDSAVADSSRFDVYKLVDAAVGGNASRAIRILGGVRAEGISEVIVIWALTRELRVLATLADDVKSGTSLSDALQRAHVWRDRQGAVRACVSRLSADEFYGLMKMCRRADAAAKGQSGEDAWQLAAEIIMGLAKGYARAA